MEPRIRYARTRDGVDIAYVTVGTGPAVLVLRQYLAPDVNGEFTDDEDVRPPWHALAADHTVVTFDYRGNGLSGPATTHSIELGALDIEAVVDHAAIDTFDVLALMSPTHIATAYAAAHPERVRRLVLWNPGIVGGSMRAVWAERGVPDIADTHFREYVEIAALRIFGWERPKRARSMVQTVLERHTPETWKHLNASVEKMDATHMAPSVTAPCLVIMDLNAPLSALGQHLGESGMPMERQQVIRRFAAMLPNAQLTVAKQGDTRAWAERAAAFLHPGEQQAEVPAASGTTVILFADIVDSTALTERLGDAAFRERARGLDEALRLAIRDNGGAAIDGKLLGDGVLATFPAASQAIAAALAFEGAAEAAQLQLHVGLHAGDVIREQNNVYGGAVNVAARISALAEAGEVLVSATVRELARTSAGVAFEDRGERELKGVGEPVRVWAVRAE